MTDDADTVTLSVTLPRETVERLHGTTVDYWTDGCGSVQVDGYDTINIQYAEFGSETADHVGDICEDLILAVINSVHCVIEAVNPYMDAQVANDLHALRTELEGKR